MVRLSIVCCLVAWIIIDKMWVVKTNVGCLRRRLPEHARGQTAIPLEQLLFLLVLSVSTAKVLEWLFNLFIRHSVQIHVYVHPSLRSSHCLLSFAIHLLAATSSHPQAQDFSLSFVISISPVSSIWFFKVDFKSSVMYRLSDTRREWWCEGSCGEWVGIMMGALAHQGGEEEICCRAEEVMRFTDLGWVCPKVNLLSILVPFFTNTAHVLHEYNVGEH